jgi:BirA family biotin operon repressor/biotin-[acetyl-CoA-carboxylase] ligase
MKLIKLDAIDSTNEFLKGLSNNQTLENFTVVTAENQTKGKGQMGAVWLSEPGKNLIMSVLVKDLLQDNSQLFTINRVIAVSVIEALQAFTIPELSIKWPNDIMSYNKKIGGILIENILKNNGVILSIVGLGLNVNQTDFDQLPKAASLASICKTTFDKDEILFKIIDIIKHNCLLFNKNNSSFFEQYSDMLFKKGIPMPFSLESKGLADEEDQNQQNFMGIIQGVSLNGKLQILLEDDTISEFDIKEIQMLY